MTSSFGSPVLVAASVELIQVERELFSLKTDVMMTVNRCSDLASCIIIVAIVFILNQFCIQ